MTNREKKMAKFHYMEWFGREEMSPLESISKYGIAARCVNIDDSEFDCYAPDPDDDTCCIRFNVCTDDLIQSVRSQTDLASFLLENGFFFKEFANMEIVDMLYYVCLRYDIMALLAIDDPPTYFRDDIVLDIQPKSISEMNESKVILEKNKPCDKISEVRNEYQSSSNKLNNYSLLKDDHGRLSLEGTVNVDGEINPTKTEDVIVQEKLLSLYNDAESFLLPEKDILEVYNSQNVRNYWTNVYDFIASLFYVILIQLYFVKNRKALRYHKLRNLGIIANDLKKSYADVLNVEDKEDCLKKLKEILQTLYAVEDVKKLARDFSITNTIDEQGNILEAVQDDNSSIEVEMSDNEEILTEDTDVVVLRILKW